MLEPLATDLPPLPVPTLLCLHGMFGGPDNFQHCADTLGTQWNVLVPPLPMFEALDDDVTVDDLVEHVRGLLDRERIEQAVVAGNSLGGHIALRLALRYPQRVRALVLSGSSGLFERSVERIPRRPSREWLRGKIREVFYSDRHVTDELVDQVMQIITSPRLARRLLCLARSAKRDNLRGELGRVRCPVLLVWGADDAVTPPAVAEEFRGHLPDAEVALIRHCGHAPMIERPEEFTRALTGHLDRLWTGRQATGRAR